MSRQTFAHINLVALKDNLHALQALSPNSTNIAVIKADAYGNGAIACAKAISADVDMFAVAIYEEALTLRGAGLEQPILILQGPHQAAELTTTLSHNLHWVFHDDLQFEWLRASNINLQDFAAHLWIKFDTGMHRLGFAIERFSEIMKKHQDLISDKTVISTHLACADEKNTEHANQQLSLFLKAVNDTKLRLSIANSAATMEHQTARQDFNRLGIALYGSSPFSDASQGIKLKAVMSLTAKIIGLRRIPKGDSVGYGATWIAPRESLIATVALGYADGYPRHAPSGTPAICRGQRIALVGRVSMDMLTFDVSNLEKVELFDEVELWGEQLCINEVASFVGTIGYELMTRVSYRVPRIYIDSEAK